MLLTLTLLSKKDENWVMGLLTISHILSVIFNGMRPSDEFSEGHGGGTTSGPTETLSIKTVVKSLIRLIAMRQQ